MENQSYSPIDSTSKRYKPYFRLFFIVLVFSPFVYMIISRTTSLFDLGSSLPTPRFTLEQMREFAFKNSVNMDYKPSYYTRWSLRFNQILESPENSFNMNDNDVIVFLHIQKTAGTSFERFLVKYLNITNPCQCRAGKKRCVCYRNGLKKSIWLFSRYSTGWECGLHADFTELFVSGCVDNALDRKEGVHKKRRYFYTSFLREPITRFISEYRHVERGATWLASRHICNGRPPTPEQLPMCFDPEAGWDGVSLDEFLACPYNLAFNRQTRMLADLTLVNCYDITSMDESTRDRLMLASAKSNLKNLAFFGLKEYMNESQWMFEHLFKLKFTGILSNWKKSKSNNTEITLEQLKILEEKNKLDIKLYEYAVKLFFKRYKQMQSDEVTVSNKNGTLSSSNFSDVFDEDSA